MPRYPFQHTATDLLLLWDAHTDMARLRSVARVDRFNEIHPLLHHNTLTNHELRSYGTTLIPKHQYTSTPNITAMASLSLATPAHLNVQPLMTCRQAPAMSEDKCRCTSPQPH